MSALVCPSCSSARYRQHSQARPDRLLCLDCGKNYSRTSGLSGVVAEILPADGYVLTCAVSDSYAHKGFLRAIRRYCDVRGYQLLVIPIKYKNPTSQTENPSEWFDPVLRPYLYNRRGALSEHLTLFGDVSTQPTAARPLSGLTTLGGVGGSDSAIFGHPKVALESIATAPGQHAKIAVTTGAITRPFYSETKSGKKGEFHHVMGALVVEREGGRFHMRHILANGEGAFYDLDQRWDGDGASPARVKALTCGDLHAVRAEPTVLDATFFAEDSMVRVLCPQHLVLHDVLDFQSASHHNDTHTRFRLARTGKNLVEGELDFTADLIARIAQAAKCPIHIVDSNHDRHLLRWLQGHPGDVANLLTFHELNVAVLRGITADKEVNPFEFWCRARWDEQTNAQVHFLAPNESLTIDKIEYGNHGDRGPNGVRGSIGAFTKVGSKMVVGHSHSPGVMDGVVQVGTSSTYDLGYNKGLSSWLHSHAVSYPNGKRSLVTSIKGHWRR